MKVHFYSPDPKFTININDIYILHQEKKTLKTFSFMSEPFVNCKNHFPRLVMQDSPCLLTTVPIPGNIRCVLDKT